jgi:hypothetical protein
MKVDKRKCEEISRKLREGKLKITFASSKRISKYLGNPKVEDFFKKVLGSNEILVTDESLLTDFPRSERSMLIKIKKLYKKDVPKGLYIVDILERLDLRRAK